MGIEMKINIGCGNDYLDGWTNIDCPGIDCKTDMQLDLRQPLPFANNSIESVRAICILEHFNIYDVENVIRECTRVLCAGGSFIITVPNAEFILNSEMSIDKKLYYLFGDPKYCGLNLGDGGSHKCGLYNQNLSDMLVKNNMTILLCEDKTQALNLIAIKMKPRE